METKFGESPHTDVSIPSPPSEAVANVLQELSLQPGPNLLPVKERKDVLQLKLQQRRSREELVNQGIMPPLKSSASFHEQRRSLERARTEDYLKRKIRSRPERSELIRMHILEETSAEPSLQAKQLQLKRARLADDLNDKISHRPGPMELIHKNILPVHSSIKQAIIETQFPKASGDNSSCDDDSNYSLSPEQPINQESPLGLLPLPSPPETLAGSSIPSPTQVAPPAPPPPPISGSPPTLKLTNGITAPSAQSTGAISQIKYQPKPNSDRSAHSKKPKDNKPKIKKLKYHQYIPPDQKGDKEPPPHLDSSYAKILQQQQLFLQLQILNQQQQHYNYHAILPAPPKPQMDQQPSSSSNSTTISSPPRPVAASSTAPSNQGGHSRQSSASLGGTKPAFLPPNLDEMKVAELKSELKLRNLPVSGTKNDLIERLRTYQELNGGSDTTSSRTAGGTTGPGAEGAGKSSKTAATTTYNNTSQQQQQFHFQCHQTSSLTADAGSSSAPAAATPQQLTGCGRNVSSSNASLTPSGCSLGAMSPEDTSFNNDPLGEKMSSPLTQLSLQPCSAAELPINIKEEPNCSTPAPCQFSLKAASLQKHCLASSAAASTTTTAPVVAMDKDKMLQEKDMQIEELTRMLRQKQRLVELLRMQLEHGKREGRVSEPLVLVRVKQEPPDKPNVPLSFGHPPFPSPPSSVSCDMDVTKVTVKQEAVEAEDVVAEATTQLPDTRGLPRSLIQTQEVQIKPEQMNKQKKQQHICLQQTTLQFAQQQAIQKLLLQQQHNIQNQQQTNQNSSQTLENQQNLQRLSQQRKKKSHKQQLKQQQQQQQLQSQHLHQQSKRHQQQMQLKQQILLKQQKSVLQQQNKQQQQTKQLQQIQIQTKIHLKQQQVLIQQKQPAQQQSPQVSQTYLNQQSGSAPSFPLDLLKSNSAPTLVTDSNGNHFLIALTSHITENQRSDAPETKTTNQITLQRLQSTPAKLPGHNPVQLPKADNQTKQSVHEGFLKQQKTKPQNGGLQVSVDQPQQEVTQCLSAPPSLQPFFKDQETAPSGKNTLSPSSQIDVCPSLDVLFSPLSPASIKTAASSPDNKDTEREDDFIDIILQTGEMSSAFKPAPDPSLEHLNPNSSASSTPPSPLQLLLPPSIPPSCDTPQQALSVQSELQTLVGTTEQKQHLSSVGSGRLEDFLESTTGKPLLGVEPGGLLTLIDDLHSQMLCTPSILDHPPSPMDTFDMEVEGEHGMDSMDWLDLTIGGVRGEETPTLAPLGPQTPPSVFSTDFLDSYDLQTHWDSCL
ncbi:myocardin-related transcription factor A isoform X2 [Dicentrarchus labrax]|uniref:SAP domain-containing protein n=3 Tax=Dicentrarchus labrax TaxID=13489 RepID=A0A8C4DUJ5_DICLA|nr:myocardin-related transcription factor A isoform X2 [Dicentrarchus labrax]XP_051243189.1 myocardin-related transcription factor A isoform X2 [Dicentrarchus labrax]XP_051243190.1 myocardin-related transcription factor A isoform X2 [Dicentrarchus labrax]XP_051243191.1 myocardin-related transcription factor A isoform X2 [Dicentrarchus labrax]XP_051243192.1 myocardin-related transcription factor A isoform X2 [Dicentrarchus labrax]XP_051243193.1 myocardin-related transcription factor A isoform X